MKKNILVYSAISLAMLTAFSCNDETTLPNQTNNNQETINFAPVLKDGGVVSRAHDGATDLAKNFVVGVYNTSYDATNIKLKQRSEVKCSTSGKKYIYKSDPVLYWDNVSDDSHDVRVESGDNASAVAIWAASVAGRSCSYSALTGTATTESTVISDTGVMDWIIETDQRTKGSDKNDLLVADFIPTKKATKDTIGLCFHHAMTKITVNVIAGDGFVAGDFTKTSTAITLKKQPINAKVNLKKAAGNGSDTGMLSISAKADSIKDITMHPLNTANDYATGKKANISFDAIVAEGKQLSAADTLGTITVGTAPSVNTYNIILNSDVLNKWNNGSDITKLSLKHGIHYVLNITIKKQGIAMTAALVPWQEYKAEAKGVISFTGTNTMISDSKAVAFKLPFTIYSKTTASDAKYIKGSSFYYTKDATKDKIGSYDYIANDTMYWANNNDARYFRAALYESATSKTVADPTFTNDTIISGLEAKEYINTADLIWGTSGNTAIKPTTSAVNMLFKHALSQVTVNLSTTTSADKIDLKNVEKVEIIGLQKKGGSMTLGIGKIKLAETNKADTIIALPNNDKTANAEYKTSQTWLVLPQLIDNCAKILITMKDGTHFSANLSKIHKAATTGTPKGMGQTTPAWNQNEKYVYTITIAKYKIDFAASILKWETKTGSGNATMEWD